jgi:putative ABC transport system substrate-binding protein
VNRRHLLALLGGAAVLRSVVAVGQQPERVRRVGVLMGVPKNHPSAQAYVKGFVEALGRFGWVEGTNIRIDYRFAAADATLFNAYAAELVGLAPDVILASTTPAVEALRQQTQAIPIVFVLVADPIGQGFVRSLARPGGNLTGFSASDEELMGKWLQLLKEIAPIVTRVAVIFNPDTVPQAPLFNRAIEAAAPSIGVAVTYAPVHDDAEIEAAVAAQARVPRGSLICLPDSFNNTHQDLITAAAIRHSLPLLGTSNFPRAGGLMSYWFDAVDAHAQAASYIDRILKGATPADLPVQRPVKYSLVINLKTAKALGLTIPPLILAGADEIIE